MQTPDLLKEFQDEAATHLDTIETGLLQLENGQGDADTVHSIFRAVHSIKGTAGFFSLKNIVELSHAMESLCSEVRNGNLIIDNEIVDVMLVANDTLKTMISTVEQSDQSDISGCLSELAAAMAKQNNYAQEELPEPKQNTRGEFKPDPEALVYEAINRGQRLFKVSVCSQNQSTPAPADLITRIQSIGQLIGKSSEEGTVLESSLSTELMPENVNFLLATVLDLNLLVTALELPAENISEIQASAAIKEICHSPGQPDSIKPFLPLLDNASKIPDEEQAPDLQNSKRQPEEQSAKGKKGEHFNSSDTIRVHVSLLNDLLNLASEMVLGRNRLLRIVETHRKDIPGLNAALQNIDEITTELQEKIMQTRMQPITRVFNKFPRIMRELCRQTGKNVKLELEGNNVELDKSIIETLGDPLTHLIRNAIDHGIERPEVRSKTSKPRSGTITLKAYHEGGRVIVDVVDDGAGIDLGKIRAKALERQIITEGDTSGMGERELLELLFRPGFSTADRITDLSGRGVGMDVVKNNIEQLGGVMEIMTSHGHGTTVRLTLPLTLAIVHSLLVEVEGQKFALPRVNLQEMVRIKPGDPSRRLEKIREAEVLRLRDKLLPTIHLTDVLGLDRTVRDKTQVVRVLIIKSGSKRFGLIVDRIFDDEEILVKQLPKHLGDCQCYSGMTILGDGKIAMILDPEGIAAKAGLRFNDEAGSCQALVSNLNEATFERQSLLLFRCSGEETFAIDLSLVSRVEKIRVNDLEKVGNEDFIQFRGEALRVIRPENYLPVSHQSSTSQTMFVIIPKLRNPIGILIEKIIDTLETEIKFSRQGVKARGLLGSAILNGHITLIVDVFQLFSLAAPDNASNRAEPVPSQATILLAEDTPFFARMERSYLEEAGCRILPANNGEEAWQLLQQNQVDAVVTDIVMPLVDGYELVRRIRHSPEFARLPVVAVTSKDDEKSRKEGFDAGFDYYEIKLEKESFLKTVKLALEKNDTG